MQQPTASAFPSSLRRAFRTGRLAALLLVTPLLLAVPGAAPARSAEEEASRAPRALPPAERGPEWTPLFRGIEYARAEASEPRPLRVHAVRIDLREPAIEFLVTPSNGERPLETDGRRTSTFLKEHGCQVAVNASPFRPIALLEGTPQDVLGLSVSRGDPYSSAAGSNGVLIITRDNRARITAPPLDTKDAYNAVGGFGLLLREGKNVAADDALHPRTAAGVSEDGRCLYLMVIDGRQKGYSEGASTAETAEWIRWLGARDALNLDGGGSTALVIAGENEAAKVLNRPIHGGIRGLERVNANHLGVRARPLGPDPGKPAGSANEAGSAASPGPGRDGEPR